VRNDENIAVDPRLREDDESIVIDPRVKSGMTEQWIATLRSR